MKNPPGSRIQLAEPENLTDSRDTNRFIDPVLTHTQKHEVILIQEQVQEQVKGYTLEQVTHRIPHKVITNIQGTDCQPLHLTIHTTASKDRVFRLQVFKEDGSLNLRSASHHSMLRHKGSAEQPTIQ